MVTRRMLIPLLAAIALVVAGCGGGDDTTTVTSTTDTTESTTGATGTEGTSTTTGGTESAELTPERATLIQEADAICEAGDAEVAAAQEQLPVDAAPEEQQAFVIETVVPNIQNQLDQLSELTPPPADEAEFAGIINDAQAALDELAQDPSLVTTEGVESPFADVNARAQAFGLQACGS